RSSIRPTTTTPRRPRRSAPCASSARPASSTPSRAGRRKACGAARPSASGGASSASGAARPEPADPVDPVDPAVTGRSRPPDCPAVTTLADLGGWSAVLRRLLAGGDLDADEAAAALTDVLAGQATPAQIAAFVVALKAKGETVEELTGLVGAML